MRQKDVAQFGKRFRFVPFQPQDFRRGESGQHTVLAFRDDGFFPAGLIGLINDNTRSRDRIEVGRIDLMKNFSFFEVPEEQSRAVLRALNHARWNGRKVIVEEADKNDNAADEVRPMKLNRAARRAAEGKSKPAKKASRTEQEGYAKPAKKDDWRQFFEQDDD